MSDSRSIKQVSKNFVIPPGSQVVLKVAKQTTSRKGELRFRKPGPVGRVVQSPPHNGEAYHVQFSDEETVLATFDELALRRQEINTMLSADDHDYTEHVIYKCMVGSKAFGLSHKDSDDDVRGIFLPPADRHWSLFAIPEQVELTDGKDEVYWELEKFIRLALKANPNILETLWTPLVIQSTEMGARLREIRRSFLSNHIYKTYSGYVLSQFRRMKNSFEKTGKFKTKHAMHLLRLIRSGIGALETGEILIDVSEFREELLAIKRGELSFEEIRSEALRLDKAFQKAFENSSLPEQPDFDTVNDFLISARRSQVS